MLSTYRVTEVEDLLLVAVKEGILEKFPCENAFKFSHKQLWVSARNLLPRDGEAVKKECTTK